jgi:hypothetical protein
MHDITIDNEVLDFLKSKAVPFEDTPNSVLRRLLLEQKSSESDSSDQIESTDSAKDEDRKISLDEAPVPDTQIEDYLPRSLKQTLQMIDLVKNRNISRVEATKYLANHFGVKIPTITGKFTRQLSMSSYQVDALLSKDPDNFKDVLIEHYPNFEDEITHFFIDNFGDRKKREFRSQ